MEYKKVFLLLVLITVITIVYKLFPYLENPWSLNTESQTIEVINENVVPVEQTTHDQRVNITREDNTPKLKYILQWTLSRNVPFVFMGKGQEGFIKRNCPNVNCFVTDNRSLLGDYTKFDVIAFAGPEVKNLPQTSLPEKRSPHQKYAFASIESADNYPVCSNIYDDYFNWTWTFRLDSEVRWGYFSIRDKANNIVGPNKVMHWIKLADMDPVSSELREELKSKSKAAAWFVSNCYTRSKRETFVKNLQRELVVYDLELDIYGSCGKMVCSRDNEEECDEMIKKTYYFYLSFENSFSEDYVTEKLLHALGFNAIPIVFGGANYTRFMPDGIYLNARELGPAKLAAKMNELILDREQYIQYFKWRNHYSYHRKSESVVTDEYCLFCSTLNDDTMVQRTSIYGHFREWWNPPDRC